MEKKLKLLLAVLIVGIIVILLLIVATGYFKDDNEGNDNFNNNIKQFYGRPFFGTWIFEYSNLSGTLKPNVYGNGTITFKEDFTLDMIDNTTGSNILGRYWQLDIENNMIGLPISDPGVDWFNYTFSNNGEYLILYRDLGNDSETGEQMFLELGLFKEK